MVLSEITGMELTLKKNCVWALSPNRAEGASGRAGEHNAGLLPLHSLNREGGRRKLRVPYSQAMFTLGVRFARAEPRLEPARTKIGLGLESFH